MAIHQTILTTNGGELSPYLAFRSDFAKHPSGAEKMRNFLPQPFGSITKRPGTQWLVQTLHGGLQSKAFPFIASDGSRYIVHFTQGKGRIFRENGTLADEVNFLTAYTWPTFSWDRSLRDLQMVQINDVAIITHPDFHPLRLRSLSDTDWRLGFWPFVQAPMLDENLNPNRLLSVTSNPVAIAWASGEDYTTGDVVFRDRCEWECIGSHVAASENRPGSGSKWKEVWMRKLYLEGDAITITAKDKKGPPAWQLGEPYAQYDVVTARDQYGHGPYKWICGVAHTASPSTKPEQALNNGPSAWANHRSSGTPFIYYWYQVVAPGGNEGAQYSLHDYNGGIWEKNGVLNPEGIMPGGIGWQAFYNIFAPASIKGNWFAGQYTTGQKVARAGHQYECIATHTPAGINRPGSGANWPTYWVEISRFLPGFAISARSPGTYWRLAPERDELDFQIELRGIVENNNQTSGTIVVQGGWNLFTYGIWYGTFHVERSTDNGSSWDIIRSYQGSGDRNIAVTGTQDTPAMLRLRFVKETNAAEESSNATGGMQRALLVPESKAIVGYALMTEYVDADEMRGVAKTPMLSGATFRWNEGAFDEQRGFPRAVTMHGFRLWFASTIANPVSIWGSRINDFANFEALTEDDAGIFRTLATSNHTPIRWMESTRRLFLGTSEGEWVEGSETQDQPITPTNIQFREYSPNGSCSHQPLKVHDGLLLLGRHGGRLIELSSAQSNESFQTADLSRLAEHLFKAGISNMAFQRTREPTLWAVTRDGNLLSFAYSRTENIAAWAMHATSGGQFLDVVVLPNDSGDDGVFFLIQRGTTTHLERFPAAWQAALENGTPTTYLDATGKPTGGNLTIASEYRPLPIDLMLDSGGTQGRVKRGGSIRLNLYQSFGGAIQYDGAPEAFTWNQTTSLMDVPLPLETGWQELTLPPGHVEDLQFSILHTENRPFTVRAIVLTWDLHEP